MSKAYLGRYEHGVVCYRCHRECRLGDEIVSRIAVPGRRKFYHASCWEALFV